MKDNSVYYVIYYMEDILYLWVKKLFLCKLLINLWFDLFIIV